MRKLWLAVLIVVVGTLSVGWSSEPIRLVRDGMLIGYEQTTLGRAFESFFKDPEWTYLETGNGTRIVQFTGKLPQDYHEVIPTEWGPSFVEYPEGVPFVWQFVILRDGFRIYHVEVDVEITSYTMLLTGQKASRQTVELELEKALEWLDVIYHG